MNPDFKKSVASLLAKAIKEKEFSVSRVSELVETPQKEFGDCSFPCFALAKALKKSPAQIAQELASKIGPDSRVSKVEAKGPYVNFFFDDSAITVETISSISRQKSDYGRSIVGKNRRIVVEYPSPNTNKPLHLGHVRNMLLGQSLSNILEFSGHEVFQVNLNNDRGVHICQAMIAYERFGNDAEPDKKPDHFVGDFYVLFQKKVKSSPELNQQAQEMLIKWEENDVQTRKLWKKLNDWALRGFSQTYETFGIKHDKVYNESEHYKGGKEIIMKAYEKGMLEKDDKNNIVINLEKHGLPNKVLLRADGTSVYMTQDVNLAKLKAEDFKMEKSVYVVGSEQITHFKQLFKILEILDVYKGELYHLAHGMVYLPHGKMKSREGKVVDADELTEKLVCFAASEIKRRYDDLSAEEIQKRAVKIGVGALRFFILKYDPLRDFVFNPGESLSFEGETGPYVQYAHARICSIFEKYGGEIPQTADLSLVSEKEEQDLVRLLADFPAKVEEASLSYKPLLICRYLLDLSQAFNNFYHAHPILTAEEKNEKRKIAFGKFRQASFAKRA